MLAGVTPCCLAFFSRSSQPGIERWDKFKDTGPTIGKLVWMAKFGQRKKEFGNSFDLAIQV